jgi:hypothetical protein
MQQLTHPSQAKQFKALQRLREPLLCKAVPLISAKVISSPLTSSYEAYMHETKRLDVELRVLWQCRGRMWNNQGPILVQ